MNTFPLFSLRLRPFSALFFAVMLTLITGRLVAEETNAAMRAALELQEQLNASQLALQQNREERDALESTLTTRLKVLEEAVNSQRNAQVESMQQRVDTLRKDLESNNRLLLTVGGGIAGVGFFVLLATGYLQWRAVNRLAEFSALVQSTRAALPPPAASVEGQLLGAATTVQSNTRMFSALTDLEKRIHELEHTAHATSAAKALTTGTGTNGSNHGSENGPAQTPHDSVLLAKGQSLLSMDQTAEALACFEEILKNEPDHGEALVKKGIALEQLGKPDQALRCYDHAINANADLTIAYLQKGGLFNRLERYEEALQCYEQALQAQEKAHQA